VLLRDGDRCSSHDAVIRVYDAAGNLIEAHAQKGGFQTTAKYCINLARFITQK
jgi:hypothetical protein